MRSIFSSRESCFSKASARASTAGVDGEGGCACAARSARLRRKTKVSASASLFLKLLLNMLPNSDFNLGLQVLGSFDAEGSAEENSTLFNFTKALQYFCLQLLAGSTSEINALSDAGIAYQNPY